MEKKVDHNYIRMLRVIPTKQQLYSHLRPITKTIQVRRTRHAGHCWRSRDELINDVLQWTPSHGQAKAWRPARTYIQQLCANTGCNLKYFPGLLAGPSGIRVGWGIETNGRFKAERPPVSVGPPLGGRAAFQTPMYPLFGTRPHGLVQAIFWHPDLDLGPWYCLTH